MSKNKIDIPIIKDGKDICRLIFTKDESMPGRYDLKLDFRKNVYEVWTYRMFARYPIIWDVENAENFSMTYHHGANDNPIMIHLKNECADGDCRYRTLPAKHIQAPNTNTMFPIPLCKLEIPANTGEKAPQYRQKSYHHPVDMGEMNVVEVFMVSEEFDFTGFGFERYRQIFSCHMGLSFEYYASYTVLSDYEKASHFMPKHGVAEERMIAIGGLNGMKIFVNKFSVPEIDRFWDKVHVTFVENELAEDMLLCTLVRYPQVNLLPGEYDGIFLGSADLEQLRPPALSLARIPVLQESCADWALKENMLSKEEKDRLEIRAGRARWKVYKELEKHERYIQSQGEHYRKQAYLFREALAELKRQSIEKSEVRDGVRYMNEKQAWLATDWCVHTYEIHMLFARFIELQEYSMQVQRIVHKNYVEPEMIPSEMDEDGIIHGTARNITPENTIFDHVWLRIDDYFEIDLTRDTLDICCEKDGGRKQVPVVVSRSRFYAQDVEGFLGAGNGMYEEIYRDIVKVNA